MCLYINSPALEGAGPRSRGFAPIADIPIARTPTGALLGATRRRVALARRAPSPRARGRARRPARGTARRPAGGCLPLWGSRRRGLSRFPWVWCDAWSSGCPSWCVPLLASLLSRFRFEAPPGPTSIGERGRAEALADGRPQGPQRVPAGPNSDTESRSTPSGRDFRPCSTTVMWVTSGHVRGPYLWRRPSRGQQPLPPPVSESQYGRSTPQAARSGMLALDEFLTTARNHTSDC